MARGRGRGRGRHRPAARRGLAARIAGIGLAGQLPTLVCLGADGPLGPAIAWSDGRADGWAAGLLDEDRRAALYRRTGMPIDGRYLGPMYRFHWHDRRAEIRRILSAKDYLCHALTGAEATDPSTATGYGVFAWPALRSCALRPLGSRSRAAAGTPAGGSTAGTLNAAGAACLGLPPGLPVAVGAGDALAGALAMTGGNRRPASLGRNRLPRHGLQHDRHRCGERAAARSPAPLSFDAPCPAGLVRPGDGSAGDRERLWLAGHDLGWGPADRAPGGRLGAGRPRTLLRALSRRRRARCAMGSEPQRRAAGVAAASRRRRFARAFLEGVQFEIRRCLEVLAETGPIERILLAGHMAESKPSLQMLADILRRPVEPFAFLSPAALGAALLAPGAGLVRRAPANLTQASRRVWPRGNTMSSTGAISGCFRAWPFRPLIRPLRSDDRSAVDR